MQLLFPCEHFAQLMYRVVNVTATKYIPLLSLARIEISHQFSVKQNSAAIIMDHGRYQRDWRDHEARSHHNDEICNLQILPEKLPKSIWQTLSKENNIRFHRTLALAALGRTFILNNFFLCLRAIMRRETIDAAGRAEMAVALHNPFLADSRQYLQPIDVLRIVPQQQSLVVQEFDEGMR